MNTKVEDTESNSLTAYLRTFMDLDIIVYDSEEDIYRFKSGAVHNAIYERCLISKRTPLHRDIAQMYSYVFFQSEDITDTLLPKIAFHYQQAQFYGHATYFYMLAAECARKSHSPEEVLYNYSEALSCLSAAGSDEQAKKFLQELLPNIVDMNLLQLSFCLHLCLTMKQLGMHIACCDFSNKSIEATNQITFPECTTRESMDVRYISEQCARIIWNMMIRRYCCCFTAPDSLSKQQSRSACLSFFELYAEMHLENVRSPKEQYYAFWG